MNNSDEANVRTHKQFAYAEMRIRKEHDAILASMCHRLSLFHLKQLTLSFRINVRIRFHQIANLLSDGGGDGGAFDCTKSTNENTLLLTNSILIFFSDLLKLALVIQLKTKIN